jgi:hypothetical protein
MVQGKIMEEQGRGMNNALCALVNIMQQQQQHQQQHKMGPIFRGYDAANLNAAPGFPPGTCFGNGMFPNNNGGGAGRSSMQ